jgi:cell division protein DivIC
MTPAKDKKESVKRKGTGFMFKLLVVLCFGVLFFASYKLFEKTYRQNQINGEIAKMQEEIDRLNQDNQNLGELIKYLQTDQFKEKEAKDKLNMIKEGESLVLVKEKDVAVPNEKTEIKNTPQVVIERPNYLLWWQFFFQSRI